MSLVVGALLSKTRLSDPEPARSLTKMGVLQGRKPFVYEGEVVRIVDEQEIERFTPSRKLDDQESVYGAAEAIVVVPVIDSIGSVSAVIEIETSCRAPEISAPDASLGVMRAVNDFVAPERFQALISM